MKNKIYCIIVGFCLILVGACSEDNKGGGRVSMVSDATAESFIGSVILKFKAPTEKDYYYTLITYRDSEGNVKHQKVGCFDTDTLTGYAKVTVSGFTDTNAHEFVLQACAYNGNVSDGVTVTGTPLGIAAAKDYVLGTVKIEPANNAAMMTWENFSGVGVTLIVTYKNSKGEDKKLVVNAQSGGSRTIDISKMTNFTIVAKNTADGEATTPKSFNVMPILDEKDIIQPGVEYFTFRLGGLNLVNITQENDENPYEYTIVTTGGDPYVPINGLKAAKAGTTFVFRYKSTRDFTLELFWCDRGGGPAGGRSTTVDVKAADTWTTFSFDYASAMETHHWNGNQGDYFRVDWGSNSDVTIHVRNMHLE